MCGNLSLSADLLRSSEDMLDGKLDGKNNFFAGCCTIKLIVFMEPRIAEKF